MVQRTRMRGLPLTAAECAEIRQVAEQVQTEHGVCNKSEIQRRLTFKVERSSIKEVLESPVEAAPVHETRTELPSDLYAAFLEFAKAHQLPIGNGIPQAITQPAPPPTEFRLTGRDSLCPDGAAFVSTMPPSPSGGTVKG